MIIPDELRNSLIKKGYSQARFIQKARVTRSANESAAIRLKHLTSGDTVSSESPLKSYIHDTIKGILRIAPYQ